MFKNVIGVIFLIYLSEFYSFNFSDNDQCKKRKNQKKNF